MPITDPRPHPALARNTGFLLSRLGAVARRHFAETIATVGLTPRMWAALNVLDAEGALSQHGLCQVTGMDPSSMVATIDELEDRGLVERRRDPSDRRANALHVTDAGYESLARGRRLARAGQQELLAPLDPEERAQLHELLLKLAGGSA